VSLSSVEVTFLNNAAAVAALRTGAARLVAADANVVRVCLFGSLAAGKATPASDADVRVVVKEARGRWADRGDAYRGYFRAADVGVWVELFVYAEDELARMAAGGNDFIKTILAEAVVVAEAA